MALPQREMDPHIAQHNKRRIDPSELNTNGITPKDVWIENEITHKSDLNMTDWEIIRREDRDEEWNKTQNKIDKKNPIHALFLAAKEPHLSDYLCMKGMEFGNIPHRISYHLRILEPPANMTTIQTEYTEEWMTHFARGKESSTQMAFSDGSVKEVIGGCGYITMNKETYDELDLQELRRDKYVSTHDIMYRIKDVAMRASIDMCEIQGITECLEDINMKMDGAMAEGAQEDEAEDNKEDMEEVYVQEAVVVVAEDKEEKNTAPPVSHPDRMIMAVDNLCVINWIEGKNRINDPIIHGKIGYIHSLIERLKPKLDVFLIKIAAHHGWKGNEIADDMAKLGMMNYLQTKTYKDYECRYSKKEWENITYNAIKKEAKRESIRRTRQEWKDEMMIKKAKPITERCLSRDISNWNITQIEAKKEELSHFTGYEWTLINQLRSGHVRYLKGAYKGISDDDIWCDECNALEDVNHRLLRCISKVEIGFTVKNELLSRMPRSRRICIILALNIRYFICLF
eukprot:390861_1